MELNTLVFETKDNIAVISLNRPKALNAINAELVSELEKVVDTIAEDKDIRAVIIAGSEKAFAAGADITEFTAMEGPVDVRGFIQGVQRTFNKIENLAQPVIAAVSGFAFGGGCELSLSCDIRISSDTANFGLPEIKLGLLPGAGGTQRLPRLVGLGKAKELIFSGDPIDANEAMRIGLVNKVVPKDALMDESLKLAGKFARQPGFTLATIKGLMNAGSGMELKSALEHEKRSFEILFATHDRKEGIQAFVEKRKAEFKHC